MTTEAADSGTKEEIKDLVLSKKQSGSTTTATCKNEFVVPTKAGEKCMDWSVTRDLVKVFITADGKCNEKDEEKIVVIGKSAAS